MDKLKTRPYLDSIKIKFMKKIYYLGTCNTCQRIIKELQLPEDFILQDIKTDSITMNQLEEMKDHAGSYEFLFSKRARLYREKGFNEKQLSETDFKNLILEYYTFLKRPVIVVNGEIFVGNSKKVVEAAKQAIHF